MAKIQNNLKECGLAFLMGLLAVAGVITSVGAFNAGGILYVITGIINLGGTGLLTKMFYDKYLKPTK